MNDVITFIIIGIIVLLGLKLGKFVAKAAVVGALIYVGLKLMKVL